MLLVFSMRNRLTEEEKSVLFALKILFGSKILDYMIVVFTHKDTLEEDCETFEDYLEDCPDFKVSACTYISIFIVQKNILTLFLLLLLNYLWF